jgi:hypothetical protein
MHTHLPNETHDNIHNSLKLLIMVGKAGGFFPLINIKDPDKIQLKMASWCFVYTCLIWFLIFIILILALYSWVASNFFNYDLGITPIKQLTKLMVFISVHLTYSLNLFCNLSSYLYLAKKWPGIMKYWHQLDQQLELNYGYPGNLTKRINITVIIWACISIGDYNYYYNVAITRTIFLGNQFVVPYALVRDFIDNGHLPEFTNYEIFEQVLLLVNYQIKYNISKFEDKYFRFIP